jgi:hypothetical protein
MTKVITRLYESAEKARSVREDLIETHRFSPRIVELYTDGDGLAKALTSEQVAANTAKEYEKRVKEGAAVLLVRAGYRPLQAPQITRDVAERMGALDMGDLVQEVAVKERPERFAGKILHDHPRLLTRQHAPDRTTFHMADWPIPLISRHKPIRESIVPPHAYMANWPIPHLSDRKPADRFAFPRHARMAAYPVPLLSKRKPADRFAFPRHARMADHPIPLLSDRKPWTTTWIGKHTYMANWPFPHLINGKTGTNAIIPGNPHMANFPIPLLSDRKPADRFAFPRHARMAAFPIPLLSDRKPIDAFAFPRHARMADKFLPLVLRETEDVDGKPRRWSFSGMLGLSTLTAR